MRNCSLIFIALLILGGLFILPKNSQANSTDITITEIMYDLSGSDSGREWLEIYNSGSEAVTIIGGSGNNSWRFNDGSNHVLNIEELVLSAKSFAVLVSDETGFRNDYPNFTGLLIDTAMSLNNTGDTLKLSADKGQTWFSEITYTSDLANGNGKSLSLINGVWQEAIPTPAMANSSFEEPPEENDDQKNNDEPDENNEEAYGEETGNLPGFLFYPRDVLINELVSDPTDGEEEWLELINNCGRTVDLSGWEIEDGSGNITKVSGSLEPAGNKSFRVITKPKGNLDNKGEIVILRYGQIIIDQVAYGDWQDYNPLDNAPVAVDPYSLARIQDAFDTNNDNLDWQVTATPTKGQSNVITDPVDLDKLSDLQDEENYSGQIIINELLPNPLGSEILGEYIELKNLSPWTIDLANWQIKDADLSYTISQEEFETTLIPGDGFFILPRSKTGLVLNNSGREKISLFQPNGRLLDSAYYQNEAPKNQSWARNQYNSWQWTTMVTPAQENLFILPNQPPTAVMELPMEAIVGEIINFSAGDSFDPEKSNLTYLWDFGDQSQLDENINPIHLYLKAGDYHVTLTVADNQESSQTIEKIIKIGLVSGKISTETKPLTKKEETPVAMSLNNPTIKPTSTAVSTNYFPGNYLEPSEVRKLPLNSQVTTRGLVAVEPNILGKTIFYLAGSGIQIYSYYQDFPELKLGDYIEVRGTTSEAGGEMRIKTKSQKDIMVLEHRQAPEPHQLAIMDINEETEGYLTTIKGEIVEISGDNLYLDDGTEEAKIYIKPETGINIKDFSEGQTIKVTGLVSQTASGYRLLPRYPEDIEIINIEQPLNTNGESEKSRLPHHPLTKYLIAAAMALAIIILGLIWQSRRKNKNGLTNS